MFFIFDTIIESEIFSILSEQEIVFQNFLFLFKFFELKLWIIPKIYAVNLLLQFPIKSIFYQWSSKRPSYSVSVKKLNAVPFFIFFRFGMLRTTYNLRQIQKIMK